METERKGFFFRDSQATDFRDTLGTGAACLCGMNECVLAPYICP